ncbi:RPS6KA5 [Symbiodinium natans]|uniref:RPS6KA5 protein n=1 Tax=Symbiodinium natans TaxID=878477 RepID=A0A812LGZ8_9DINO|nr:RPS6KA5 [Symbiodinium natans]
MHYDIGSEHEEGEEEEEREDDPIIDVTDAPGEEEVDYEQDTYHNKDLRDLKIPALPSTAAGYRAWRNGVLTSFSSIDKSGNARILRWLQVALDPAIGDRQMRNLQVTSDGLPRLDAFLAAQLTDPKHLKGDYGVAAQAFTERAHALGVQPSGRALLAMLSRRFRVDRIRGATVSQQTLLAIQLEGFSQQQLQAFREKVEFCLNGFSPEAWPAESTLFSWLYSKLKHCRLLSRAVDKIKDSNPGSNKRTFAWLWSQLVELLDELREEANEESIRDTLIKPKAKAAPAPKKEERSRDKPDKPTPANPAPPAKTKGSGKDGKDKDGKGKGGKGSGKGADSQKTPNKPKAKSGGKGQGSKAEGKAPSKGNAPKATVPCLFFPKGTCNRGENCPFSHETSPGNKAPGSKTTGASATAKSSAAAVALLLPTTARGASVDGSSTPSKTTFWKRSGLSRFFQFVSGWFTVFSNICAPACPATVTPLLVASQHQHPQQGWFYHEWIADSGAGRSLESREALNEQGIPEDAYAHMAEQAPTVSFSTGNGVVDSGLMLGFEGSILGNNSAYLLDNCPSVKSLGELVETKSMPFVWLPGKLPMFLSSVEHVQVIEESAICADRVEGNVPIFREQVRFVSPSTVAMPGFMSDARKAKPLARTTIEPSRHTTYRPSPHITEESTLLELLQDPGVPPPPLPPPAIPPGSGSDSGEDVTSERQKQLIKEESTRAVHLAAGFHVVPDLWHVSVQFAAQTLTVVPWQGKDKSRFEVATGSPFEGPRLPLGQLVHYRIHDPSRRHKFEATTAPGLFAGWRFEHGFVYRDVIWVLDYEAVKSKSIGYRDMIPVPYAEVHVPETETFPLKAAADLALREFQDPKLEAITALDIPFSSLSPADPPRRRAEYITLERILKFGATPGCKACTFDSVKHSPKCRARFDALIKADRIALTSKPPEPVPPAELPEGVGLHPSSEPAVEGLVAKVELGVTQVFVDVNRERVRQRKVQTLIGKDVLFEYACGDSSELSQAASEIGINSIRLCRSMIDLSNEEHVKQVQGQVLATAIANHGRIAVEWPKGSGWWDLPEWKEFQDEHGLHKVSFDGCMAGVKGREHPIRKPWSVATNDLRLVQFLGQLQCDGSHQHEAAEGSQTKQTEAYPRELAHNIVEAWYPQRYHRHIPSMVTKNLTKREWKADPRGVAAVKKEAEGGDCIFDQFGNHVLFEDVATTPTSLVALNIALFFGCQDGNAVSLADAIQAFLQADLAEAGEPDTWVILPEELWLDTWHKAYPSGSKLVVRLKRSLYGHPLAGKLWQKHLASVLTSFGGIEMDLFPSNFIFQMGSHTLLLNVYVDDLTLSGAKHLHAQFWKRLRAHIKLEDECYIEASNARILGRGHRIQRGSDFTTLVLDMSAFAEQVVEAYCELADVPKAKLRNVTTPSLSEALMSDEDLQQPGTLSHVAAKVLMKALWLGRLARPDLCFIIGRLAEAIAMASAMFGEALNIQVMMEHLLGRAIDVVFHQDNETLLKVLATGYSAKLRHCNRVHRVNIASMSEQLESPQVTAVYCKSESQIANGLTKVIPPAEWPHTLAQFGLTASSDGPHLETAVAALAEANLAAEVFAGRCEASERIVAIAFLIRNAERLSPSDRATLLSAGFNLPSIC